MFLIDEIHKLLDDIATNPETNRNLKLGIPEFQFVKVTDFNVEAKVQWQDDYNIRKNLRAKNENPFRVSKVFKNNNQYTADMLFLSIMNKLIIDKLMTQSDNFNISGPRLLICDQSSLKLLNKTLRLMADFDCGVRKSNTIHELEVDQSWNQYRERKYYPYILYRKPFNFNAIMLISDIIEIFERDQQPIIQRRYVSELKKYTYSFNYSLVKSSFPYLKISDIVIMFIEKGHLDKPFIDVNSSNENLIFRMLSHFARNFLPIDLRPIIKQFGIPHQYFDNVLFLNQKEIKHNTKSKQTIFTLRLPVNELIDIGQQILSICDQLRFHICSVCFKVNERFGQTKSLATFLSSNSGFLAPKHRRPVKILVLDRLHSIRSCLTHGDKYGSFLDQECSSYRNAVNLKESFHMSLDKMDEQLQMVPLTEVLTTIIQFATNTNHAMAQGNFDPSLQFGLSLSIHRHMNHLKLLYDILNGGYLLMLRFESNLMSIANQLAANWSNDKNNKITNETFLSIRDQLKRITEAMSEFIDRSCRSSTEMDILRLLCIALDVINFFNRTIKGSRSEEINNIFEEMIELKKSIKSNLNLKNRLKRYKSNITFDDSKRVLSRMDDISNRLLDEQGLTCDMAETISSFRKDKLCSQIYKDINIQSIDSKSKVARILVVIGPLTSHELTQIKSMEEEIRKSDQSMGSMLIISSGTVKPEQVVSMIASS